MTQALIPKYFEQENVNRGALSFLVFVASVIFLWAMAQISFPLPFTPVPVTGQTFGVLFISLLSGRRRALFAVGAYLALGFTGLPVFALGHSGFVLGPTSGYLLGMLLSSWIVGSLADRGYARSFFGCLAAGYLGSFSVFLFGLVGLSFFVPFNKVLWLGYFPFVLGDSLKIFVASALTAFLNT